MEKESGGDGVGQQDSIRQLSRGGGGKEAVVLLAVDGETGHETLRAGAVAQAKKKGEEKKEGGLV